MPVIDTSTLVEGVTLPENEQIYNGLDCCITHEVFKAIQFFNPSTKQGSNLPNTTYNFERALQAPVLDMMLRGFKIDPLERQKGIEILEKELVRLNGLLNRFSYAVWDKPLNANSPKQLIDFFYGRMQIPEIWTSKKGERKLSLDREALEKLDNYFHARPIVATILAIRDATKQLSVLKTEVDSDGRMRTSYNIAGTETGRFSSSTNAFGTGCVLPSTEVLTPVGWKEIQHIKDGDIIAQYTPQSKAIEFVECKMFSTNFSGNMLRVQTEQTQQTLTPGHRVLHHGANLSQLLVDHAADVALLSQTTLPLGGFIEGNKTYPKFLPMLMADFSKEQTIWRGAFKKQRKIERFLALAKEFDLKFDEISAMTGYRRFSVKGQSHLPKYWGAWVLSLSKESAQELLEEARHWDAHDRKSGFIFYSANRQEAEWFMTLAHLAGRSATLRRQEQNEGSYSSTTMWCVNVKSRKHARVQRKHWQAVPYSGPVYCPQVPSSFWIMRESSYISITGNTNLQNITASLRKMFIADPGYKICGIDLEQAESREVGWLSGTLCGDWSYLDACYSGDLHTLVARTAWPDLDWSDDPKRNRAIADTPFYRHLTYRDMSKKLGHGSNYRGLPPTMARHAKIPVAVADQFQRRYFGRFPGIPKWHRHVAQQLQTTNTIITPFGRERTFFGRPNDDTTLREAIAFSPQSATADRLNLILWRIWKYMPHVQLIAQVHDALYFQYPEHMDEVEIISEALSYFDLTLEHESGHKLIVPGEAKVGWNWGNFDPDHPDKNPDGLAKWKGKKDQRVRTPLLSQKL